MPKIVVVVHRDYFYWNPHIISDQNTLFKRKEKQGGRDFYHIKFFNFLPFFLQQPPHVCKYFNFAVNKLSPRGMNLFFMLSRHRNHLNFVGIQMLCMQRGQNMVLFIGCCVFYGVDGIYTLSWYQHCTIKAGSCFWEKS